VYKRRLDKSGKAIDEGEKHEVGPQLDDELETKNNGSYCGSCYGAGSQGECCNSCEEVSTLSEVYVMMLLQSFLEPGLTYKISCIESPRNSAQKTCCSQEVRYSFQAHHAD
jgi:hypothetical protein